MSEVVDFYFMWQNPSANYVATVNVSYDSRDAADKK
jgi:hypothetical protein